MSTTLWIVALKRPLDMFIICSPRLTAMVFGCGAILYHIPFTYIGHQSIEQNQLSCMEWNLQTWISRPGKPKVSSRVTKPLSMWAGLEITIANSSIETKSYHATQGIAYLFRQVILLQYPALSLGTWWPGKCGWGYQQPCGQSSPGTHHPPQQSGS